ncbi:isopenicillin N synthase family oxygenase [soil metagenome]
MTMQELPIVDASAYFSAHLRGQDTSAEALALGRDIKEACHAVGMFYLVGYDIDQLLIDSLMVQTAAFFACSQSDKEAISIKNSPQFRGYGMLKNYRDWREQIHIGVESNLPALASNEINESLEANLYWQLWGKNQWPSTSDGNQFKGVVLDYFAAIESLARTVLTLLAQSLDKPANFFTERMKDRPYLLMKAMSYLPQQTSATGNSASGTSASGTSASGNSALRVAQMGVTAHCDWSWLTFLIQDDVGGLEAQDINGRWRKVNPLANSLVVNTGELLEIETGGYLRASPHRVINERIDRQRFSVPVFINPALDASILPAVNSSSLAICQSKEHVHKVIRPGRALDSFVFGDSEFERKAKGIWCYDSECVSAL